METGFRFRLLVAVVFTQHWVFALFFRARWVGGGCWGMGGRGVGGGGIQARRGERDLKRIAFWRVGLRFVIYYRLLVEFT